MKQIDRTTQILLALLVIGVWALLIRSFAAPSAADTAKLSASATSDEISVKRLNIVGEDGKPRLISLTLSLCPALSLQAKNCRERFALPASCSTMRMVPSAAA